MFKAKFVSAFVIVTVAAAVPVVAGYKLMGSGKPVAVAKSTLTVTPNVNWNRLGARPGRNAESWTIDGLSLNDMTFYFLKAATGLRQARLCSRLIRLSRPSSAGRMGFGSPTASPCRMKKCNAKA
jgi:hypothetical protein